MKPGDSATVERRRVPRFEPAELAFPVLVFGSRFVNIGAHGLMLEAPAPLAPGSRLSLSLILCGRRCSVSALVRACVARPAETGRPWGVGVEFEEMDELTRQDLARVLVSTRSGRA